MQKPLYFTGPNAIFQRRENVREKMRIAFSIAFYDTKCDRRKSELQNRGPKRKCVKTLAPVDESNVSHVEGTQRSSENKQNSWDIRLKLTFRRSKSAEMLKHSLKSGVSRARSGTTPGRTPGPPLEQPTWPNPPGEHISNPFFTSTRTLTSYLC